MTRAILLAAIVAGVLAIIEVGLVVNNKALSLLLISTLVTALLYLISPWAEKHEG